MSTDYVARNGVVENEISCLIQHGASSFLVGGRKGLPSGVLFTPFAPIQFFDSDQIPVPSRCLKCAAFLNYHSKIDHCYKIWTCNFCNFKNPLSGDDCIRAGCASRVVEYFDMSTNLPKTISPYDLRTPNTDSFVYIFLVDGNMRKEALNNLSESMIDATSNMNQNAKIALIVYTGVVSVYSLGQESAGAAHVLPGGTIAPRSHLDSANFAPLSVFGSVNQCTQMIMAILSSIRGSDGTSDATFSKRIGIRTHKRKRSLGAAIEYSLQLASSLKFKAANLFVFAGGCPNHGPGAVMPSHSRSMTEDIDVGALNLAVTYFKVLSNTAALQGIRIDVFCVGTEVFGMPVLHALTKSTGGCVLLRPIFEAAFKKDFIYLIYQSSQHSLKSHCNDVSSRCGIDIRISSGVKLHTIINPTIIDSVPGLPWKGKGTSPPCSEVQFGSQNLHISTIRADPRFSLAMYFSEPVLNNECDAIPDYVYFQYVVRYLHTSGMQISRVITDRLKIRQSKSGSMYTSDIDPGVTAVLIAKYAVLQAYQTRYHVNDMRDRAKEINAIFGLSYESPHHFMKEGLIDSFNETRCYNGRGADDVEACNDFNSVLEETIRKLQFPFEARAYVMDTLCTIANSHRAANREKSERSKSKLPFPIGLDRLLKSLYHLHRGPLLGRMRVSMDEGFYLRHTFLGAGINESLLMMAPELMQVEMEGTKIALARIEPETTAMLSNRVLVLDSNNSVYIWAGKEAFNSKDQQFFMDSVMKILVENTEKRFPSSEILVLTEGGYMARHLTCRLIPSHQDVDKDGHISDADILRKELPYTEDLSFRQFCYKLFCRAQYS